MTPGGAGMHQQAASTTSTAAPTTTTTSSMGMPPTGTPSLGTAGVGTTAEARSLSPPSTAEMRLACAETRCDATLRCLAARSPP